MKSSRSLPAALARALVFLYRMTFSAIAGRSCRYLPTCSEYADEAIRRHGLWAGGWMSLARICRCGPWGGDGFDPPPAAPSPKATALTPWRHGVWRAPLRCEAVETKSQERAIDSTTKP